MPPDAPRSSVVLLALLASCGESAITGPEPWVADILHHEGQWTAVGNHQRADWREPTPPVVLESADGERWTAIDLPGRGVVSAIAALGDRRVAVGGEWEILDDGGFRPHRLVAVSENGGPWEVTTSEDTPLGGLAAGAGRFVAVSHVEYAPDAQQRFLVSEDGRVWRETIVPPWFPSPRIVFDRDRFWAFGGGGGVAESIDGVTWMEHGLPVTSVDALTVADGALIGIAVYDCCYGEVPDEIEHYRLARNADGTWALERIFIDWIREIEVGAGIALAGDADGGLWRSEDLAGWRWELIAAPNSNALAAGGGRFVLAGADGLWFSDDGLSWTAAAVETDATGQ